jgi:hypothetical protein
MGLKPVEDVPKPLNPLTRATRARQFVISVWYAYEPHIMVTGCERNVQALRLLNRTPEV